MIFYAIEKIAAAGIKEIYINTNEGDTEFSQVVGDGRRWGVKITCFEQRGGPRGIADVVRQAQKFIKQSPFILYLGDNIVISKIQRFTEFFKREKLNCFLALARVADPTQFGVPVLLNGQITKVIEKPANPASPFAVTGIYIYDHHIFNAIRHLKPSARGEYEISDAHSWLIKHGYKVGYKEITGWWKDTGRSEDLLEANQLLLGLIKKRVQGKVDPKVSLQGTVRIGKGTEISGRTKLRGPLTIGENCVISDSYIGPFTSIGDRVEIHGAEIENSIIFDEVDIETNTRIVDSLIGKNTTIIPKHNSLPSGHKMIVGSNSLIEL